MSERPVGDQRTAHAGCQVYRIADLERIFWRSHGTIRNRAPTADFPVLRDVVQAGLWSRTVVWAALGLDLPPRLSPVDGGYLPASEIARLLGVHVNTIDSAFRDGALPWSWYFDRRCVRASDLEVWLGDNLRAWPGRDHDPAFTAISAPPPRPQWPTVDGPSRDDVEALGGVVASLRGRLDAIEVLLDGFAQSGDSAPIERLRSVEICLSGLTETSGTFYDRVDALDGSVAGIGARLDAVEARLADAQAGQVVAVAPGDGGRERQLADAVVTVGSGNGATAKPLAMGSLSVADRPLPAPPAPTTPAPARSPRDEATAWARDLASDLDVRYLDTETTDLEDRVAEIVEVAVLDAGGTVLFQSLVKPRNRIPADATDVHGITDADVAGAPTWAEVAAEVLGLIRGRRVVAYNAGFDGPVIEAECRRAGVLMPKVDWCCAMKAYARWRGEPGARGGFRWRSLGFACEEFGIVSTFHRAAADAEAGRRVVLAMAQFGESHP